MRLSDRHTIAELIPPFITGTFAVLLMLVGKTLFDELLERFLRDRWPIELVMRVLFLSIPTWAVLTLPVSTALAASLAVTRMARDNEITILRGSGQSLLRIFAPILAFGAVASAANLYLSDRVVPWAWKEQFNVQAYLYKLPKDPIAGGYSLRVDNYLISFNTAQKVNDDRLRFTKVTIIKNDNMNSMQDNGKYPEIITADSADYERGVWYLKSVVIHTYQSSGITAQDTVSASWELPLTIDFNSAYRPPSGSQADKLSFADLTKQVNEARRQGRKRDANDYEVNRQFKLSLPLMCFVFALCGPPLAMRFARTGAFTGVLLSIVVVFIAWNLLLLMKSVGMGGYLPPAVAAWLPNGIFTVLGIILLRTQE